MLEPRLHPWKLKSPNVFDNLRWASILVLIYIIKCMQLRRNRKNLPARSQSSLHKGGKQSTASLARTNFQQSIHNTYPKGETNLEQGNRRRAQRSIFPQSNPRFPGAHPRRSGRDRAGSRRGAAVSVIGATAWRTTVAGSRFWDPRHKAQHVRYSKDGNKFLRQEASCRGAHPLYAIAGVCASSSPCSQPMVTGVAFV